MAEEKRVSVIKNYFYSLSYQILLLIVPLITMPYLARTLGIDSQGTFSILYAVISCFVMFGCVGLNLYGQREIAYYKNDREKRNRIFWEIELIRIFTLFTSLLVYFAFIWFNINVKSIVNVYEPLYFVLFAIEIPSAMLDISWYYQGIENFRLQTIRNFIVKLVGLALILIFIKKPADLWLYIVIYTGMNLFGNLSLWVNKLRSDGGFSAPDKKRFKVHLKRSIVMFLPQIATTVYAQLDRVMIGGLINDGNLQAGVYDNAEKIVKIALTVVTSIALVMLSRVANTYMKNDHDKARGYIYSSFRLYMCLSIPIMFGIAAIAGSFVERFFTDTPNAELITPVIIVLCPIILFIGGSSVFGTQYLLPTNRMKPYTLSVFTGMVVNVILNLVFIPLYGAKGAAIATVIAEFSVLTVQMIVLRREFSPVMYLHCWRNFLAGAVMFACVVGIGKLINSSTIVSLFVQITLGVTIYFGLLLLLRDPFIKKYMHAGFNKLLKR